MRVDGAHAHVPGPTSSTRSSADGRRPDGVCVSVAATRVGRCGPRARIRRRRSRDRPRPTVRWGGCLPSRGPRPLPSRIPGTGPVRRTAPARTGAATGPRPTAHPVLVASGAESALAAVERHLRQEAIEARLVATSRPTVPTGATTTTSRPVAAGRSSTGVRVAPVPIDDGWDDDDEFWAETRPRRQRPAGRCRRPPRRRAARRRAPPGPQGPAHPAPRLAVVGVQVLAVLLPVRLAHRPHRRRHPVAGRPGGRGHRQHRDLLRQGDRRDHLRARRPQRVPRRRERRRDPGDRRPRSSR